MGYLGYELKVECGGDLAWLPPEDAAVLLLPDRFLVLDKHVGHVYVVALYEDDVSSREAEGWVALAADVVASCC